jgi:hypothetical protein
VVSRGIALIALVAFSILSLYYVYMRPSIFESNSPFEAPKESFKISATWEEFLADCGGEVIVENNVHARATFNRKYENNFVNWTGYFAEIKGSAGAGVPFVGSDHTTNILVKMMPSESVLYPDLVLSVPSTLYSIEKETIKSLQKGDEIRFEAKIVSMGNEFKMHHLHAKSIKQTGNSVVLSDIIVRESTLP